MKPFVKPFKRHLHLGCQLLGPLQVARSTLFNIVKMACSGVQNTLKVWLVQCSNFMKMFYFVDFSHHTDAHLSLAARGHR